MNRKRIHSLDGLRVLSMLIIFNLHILYTEGTSFAFLIKTNGQIALSIFMVLSGYLIAMGYGEKLKAGDRTTYRKFIGKRIGRVYGPYLMTMLLAIPLYLAETGGSTLPWPAAFHLVSNVFLVQTLMVFRSLTVSINPVAWFISALFINYLFVPWMFRLWLDPGDRTRGRIRRILIQMVLLLGMYCLIYMFFRGLQYIVFPDAGLDLIYLNPLIQTFPFQLGILLYALLSCLKDWKIRKGTLLEGASLFLVLFWWAFGGLLNLPALIVRCADMVISMVLILVFTVSTEGAFSRILGSRPVSAASAVSMEFYLVHYMVIQYGLLLLGRTIGFSSEMVVAMTLVFFAASLFLALLIKKIWDPIHQRLSAFLGGAG